jgi:glycosyltransferase involved in cell wall biosynthesis
MSEAAMRLRTARVTPLPETLAVGGGTALFVDGRCTHPAGPVAELDVLVDGGPIPAIGWGLAPPRMRGEDYWWAIVPFAPLDGDRREVLAGLRARAPTGELAEAELGTVTLTADLPDPEPAVAAAAPGDAAGPLVAIAMATYEPDPEMFAEQVDSIRKQSHRNWICLISDDASSPATLARMREVLGEDRRFALSPAPANRGFYANFERALTMVPRAAAFVALSDQDDRWRADKLERLLAGLEPDAGLVYSDMRITDRAGTVLSDTYWGFRRNNYTDFGSLLIANTVTGAAALLRSELLADVLPFPPRHGGAFHDHWIAQVAMALGPISYVDAPLHDYVQHDEAAIGYLRANGYGRFSAPPAERVRLWYERWSGRGYRLGWRVPYFRLYCRVRLATTALQLRLGERITADKRAVLAAIDDNPGGIVWLARRGLRDLRGPTETIGRERVMLAGLAWRRGAEARKRVRRLRRRVLSAR